MKPPRYTGCLKGQPIDRYRHYVRLFSSAIWQLPSHHRTSDLTLQTAHSVLQTIVPKHTIAHNALHTIQHNSPTPRPLYNSVHCTLYNTMHNAHICWPGHVKERLVSRLVTGLHCTVLDCTFHHCTLYCVLYLIVYPESSPDTDIL